MDMTVLRGQLQKWAFPLGPEGSIEEVYREMEKEAHNLGSSAATELVEALLALD